MRQWRERDKDTNRWRFRADFRVKGRRYRPVAGSKTELLDIIEAIRKQARADVYGLPTEREVVLLKELVGERVADLDLRKRNDRRKKVILEHFRDFFTVSQEVASLTRRDLLDFKRKRVAESKLKPNSINRELECVNAMLNDAGSYFPSLESWKPPRMPYETVESGRERVITEGESARLLAELRAPRRKGEPATATRGPRAAEQVLAWQTRQIVADLFELAPLVGMRRSEMRLMEKSWIDFDAALVRLPARIVKTRRARDVPLNDAALEILRRRCAEFPAARYVFTNSRGTNAISEFQMYRAIRKAAERAKVPYGRNIEGGFTLHDARHTAVTRMLHMGADLKTVADVVGHSAEVMTMRYAHSSLESRRRAVALLSNDGKEKSEKQGGESG